eukprot:6190010-Pleurochrysis_carterae.AAC.1
MADYNWPAGHRPPPIRSSVLKGARGTVQESGNSLRYTVSEMLHWAEHSDAFLRPVVADPMALLAAYEFSAASVAELERDIYQHQKLFKNVPQYKGLMKPKHIFAQQYPVDVHRNGPSRSFLWAAA